MASPGDFRSFEPNARQGAAHQRASRKLDPVALICSILVDGEEVLRREPWKDAGLGAEDIEEVHIEPALRH